MSTPEAFIIKQARRMILEALNMTYPSGMFLDSLFRVTVGIDPTYDRSLFVKDISYLIAKGYVEYVSSPISQQIFSKKIASLTATGKEIADQTMTDKALEI